MTIWGVLTILISLLRALLVRFEREQEAESILPASFYHAKYVLFGILAMQDIIEKETPGYTYNHS